MKTLLSSFQQSLRYQGHFYEVETERSASYTDIEKSSGQIAGHFYDLNQRNFSVILPNSIDYVECFLAVLKSKNIFAPIPYFSSLQEISKILQYIDPAFIITDRDDIKEKLGQSYKVIDPAELRNSKSNHPAKTISPNDMACLYYSSGTTGNPKGILYSHENMYELISSIIRGFKFTNSTSQLAFLPFGHTASINYNILPALMTGSPLYISKGFEFLRSNFFEVLSKYKISYTEVVPSVIFMLLKLKYNLQGLDLSTLEFIGCGSSTLPLESQKQFMEAYGIPVANLYGLSETGPSHIDDPRDPGWKPGSIGKPLDVNECKIADDGEILLKGPNIFKGYYKNDHLYNEVVKDGWFHTGDLGRFENGRFYFEDRKKDLIIKAGINIVPAEIEEAIYKCPLVSECVVVGKKDDMYGEVIVAVIVPRSLDNMDKLIPEIKIICKNYLSNFKLPSVFKIVENIPKTYSGKLLRKKIREEINADR